MWMEVGRVRGDPLKYLTPSYRCQKPKAATPNGTGYQAHHIQIGPSKMIETTLTQCIHASVIRSRFYSRWRWNQLTVMRTHTHTRARARSGLQLFSIIWKCARWQYKQNMSTKCKDKREIYTCCMDDWAITDNMNIDVFVIEWVCLSALLPNIFRASICRSIGADSKSWWRARNRFKVELLGSHLSCFMVYDFFHYESHQLGLCSIMTTKYQSIHAYAHTHTLIRLFFFSIA